MDFDSLEKHDWIPESDKARLRELMAEWTGPGKGYVLIAVPPGPGQDGYTIFQPCIDPEPENRRSENPQVER
jgi:hypothetical protein